MLWALKAAIVIYIHTINHFLNEVSSFQKPSVTPEWKGLWMTHHFKNITQRVFLTRASNNHLIAGDKLFFFQLQISHLEFRFSGENSLLYKSKWFLVQTRTNLISGKYNKTVQISFGCSKYSLKKTKLMHGLCLLSKYCFFF